MAQFKYTVRSKKWGATLWRRDSLQCAKHCLTGLILVLCWASPAVAGTQPQAVLDVLPSAAALGPGWNREICLLSDPLSKPSEMAHTASPISEATKKERRAAQENPTNSISAGAHTHFTLQMTNGPWLYDVQISRYRDRERQKADFDHLLNLKSERFEKAPVTGLGEAAVYYRDAQGVGGTLWFRRADFTIWIAPMTGRTSWADDSPLQHLAKTLDQRIVQGAAQTRKEQHAP